MTLDLEFQKGMEQILTNIFNSELASGNTKYSEGVYAVVLNPNTGAALLWLVWNMTLKRAKHLLMLLERLLKLFTPGSVVTGATLTAGWENGVLIRQSSTHDQPIQFGVQALLTLGLPMV